MARKKFKEGFKEEAVAYCKKNTDKTIKECANDLDLGYSTLRRWISQVEAENEKKAKKAENKQTQKIEQKAENKSEVQDMKKDEVISVDNSDKTTFIDSDALNEPSISYVPEFYRQQANTGIKEELLENVPSLSKITEKVELISLYKKSHDLKKKKKQIEKIIKNKQK